MFKKKNTHQARLGLRALPKQALPEQGCSKKRPPKQGTQGFPISQTSAGRPRQRRRSHRQAQPSGLDWLFLRSVPRTADGKGRNRPCRRYGGHAADAAVRSKLGLLQNQEIRSRPNFQASIEKTDGNSAGSEQKCILYCLRNCNSESRSVLFCWSSASVRTPCS